MKLNTIGICARQIVNELHDLWSTHLSAHKSSAHHPNEMGAVEQVQDPPAEALPTPASSGKPENDQRAALNTWEGEGGTTATTGRERHDAQEPS